MRNSAEERLKQMHRKKAVASNPIDVVLGAGVSMSYGVNSGERLSIGEAQSIRIPSVSNGQTSKLI